MVNVQLGLIQTGSWSENTGMFTGQNIQNAWDSHTPTTAAVGPMMGDWNMSFCQRASMHQTAVYGQPIFDQDTKGNAAPTHIR